MSDVKSDDYDGKPVDPEQARLFARARRMMLVSGLATFLGIAIVIGVIGYRVFKSDGSVKDVTALAPKGARIVQTAVAGDYVVVTFDINGTTEIRSFEAKTLRPAGRLRFATEP